MEASRLFLTPTFKEEICKNLSFEEAIHLRDALKLDSLKCPIPVIDPVSQKEIILPGVNSTTIAINELIKKYGIILAFFKAVETGQNVIVQTLLTAGVDVNAINLSGQTALMMTVDKNQNEMVQTLLTAKNINVNKTNRYGWTALMTASAVGWNEMVKILLTVKDINVNTTNQSGYTALMLASMRGQNEVVKTLLTAKNININATDQNGKTALMLAAENNHQQIIQYLKEAGAH